MVRLRAAELRRRSVVKSLLWRIIGIAWTWIGAYLIVLIVPPTLKNASLIATLIVIYHHSTRMVMYYIYERIWASVPWGRHDPGNDERRPMSLTEGIVWTTAVLVAMGLIFTLIRYVTPLTKG